MSLSRSVINFCNSIDVSRGINNSVVNGIDFSKFSLAYKIDDDTFVFFKDVEEARRYFNYNDDIDWIWEVFREKLLDTWFSDVVDFDCYEYGCYMNHGGPLNMTSGGGYVNGSFLFVSFRNNYYACDLKYGKIHITNDNGFILVSGLKEENKFLNSVAECYTSDLW